MGQTDPVRWPFYRSLSSLNGYISFGLDLGFPQNTVEAPSVHSFVNPLACWWTLPLVLLRPSRHFTIYDLFLRLLYDSAHDVRPLTLFRFIS